MADLQKIGGYAFLIGVIIAIIAGLVSGASLAALDAATAGIIALVLVVLGLIVGLLNVKDKEVNGFLIASIALMVVGSANLGLIDNVVAPLGAILQVLVLNITIFVAPAALIVALKAIYDLASVKGVIPSG